MTTDYGLYRVFFPFCKAAVKKEISLMGKNKVLAKNIIKQVTYIEDSLKMTFQTDKVV